jgi:hypothetical protein
MNGMLLYVYSLRLFEEARNYLMLRNAKEALSNDYVMPHLNIVGGFISPVHNAYGKKSLIEPHHRLNMALAGIIPYC